MNILFVGDFHIKESELKEINNIFDEILILKDKHNINRLYITGDTFDKINPTPNEIDCFAKFIQKINIPIILISAQSHESISETESILNHFGILKNTILVTKEYQDKDHLFMGHFTLKESKINYGTTKSKKEFSKYKYVILGHQHSFELINPNICHLGSIRYVDFAEVDDTKKVVLLIENYKEDKEKCHFLELKSPYPMVDLHFIKKMPQTSQKQAKSGILKASVNEFKAKLDKLDLKTKVRIIFNNFEEWKEFLPYYHKYKEKFFVFKDKKDFIISLDKHTEIAKQKTGNLKESLKKYLEENKIEKDIAQILLNEIK